jgi:ATP-dependent Lon protease
MLPDDSPVRMPDDFEGIVRMFPLPEMVLFPNVVQPLHIFEPRYCDMLDEALATDRLIAMALLQPGDELAGNKPPVAQTVCIGKIISHSELEESRHNVLLVGVQRAKIISEIDTASPFRKIEVELLEDEPDHFDNDQEREELRQSLLDFFRNVATIEQASTDAGGINDMIESKMPLGMLSDLLAFSLPLPTAVKQQLLSETRVLVRARKLCQFLKNSNIGPAKSGSSAIDQATFSSPAGREFPPKFSAN